VYGFFIDDLMSSYNVSNPCDIPKGNLLCEYLFNEMKVAAGIVTNARDGKTVGFTASRRGKLLNMAAEVEDLIKSLDKIAKGGTAISTEGDEDGFYAPATSVNLFRGRNIYNNAFNAEFYFNNGSLTGDELLGQMLHALCGFEVVGLIVIAGLGDTGGSNYSLFQTLRRNSEVNGAWPDAICL